MLKKISLVLAASFIFSFAAPAMSAQITHVNGYVPFPVDLSYLSANPPREISSGIKEVKAITIPAKYDLRDVNGKSYVTSVKDQGEFGTCWAFAAIGAMESNYLMQGGSELDLSEMHLAWYTFKNSDKSKAFKNLSSSNDPNTILQGGNSFYPAALYGRLDGPVKEDETNLKYGEAPDKENPEDFPLALRLRDVYYLNFGDSNVNADSASRKIVKQRVMENGAVVANYDDDQNKYHQVEKNNISYYTKGKKISHAVLIVGWDDNYSKDNFSTKPKSDGAWLIKNSWGNINPSNHHEETDYDGYFWMSYEQYLEDGSAFIVEDVNSNLKAYYYDALGWNGSSRTYQTKAVYAANVFKAESSGEKLTEVAFFTPDNNVTYEISVYTGSSLTDPVAGTLQTTATTTGTEPFAGYHTITLDNPVALTEDEYFSVIVKFTDTNRIPTESKRSNLSDNFVCEEGSFISGNGETWSAAKDFNTCVRAFTDTGSGVAPKIRTASLPDGVINSSYSQKINASGSHPLTWSSSGTLPAGLSLSTSGVLSGTPTESGDFNITITATNNLSSSSKSFTLTITGTPEITTSEISGYAGMAIDETLQLSFGTAEAWSIASGKLPKGLKLDKKTGKISGKPSAQSDASVTFKASSEEWEDDVTGSVKFSIEPKPVKPTISTSKLADGTIETAYTAQIVTKGTDPVTLVSEGLPAGLSMNESGAISGTPTVTGDFTVKITATNLYTELNETTVTKNIKLKIKAKPPVIAAVAATDLPMAIVDKDFDGYHFSLSSGTEPVTWTASGLPKGLVLSASGDLTGKPTKAGSFNIALKAKNSANQASLKVPFVVYQIPEITTTKLAAGTTGKKYTVKLAAKGTTPITSWDIANLPEPLIATPNANGSQVTITGTPTEAGTFSLSVTASNAAGTSEAKPLSLTVNGIKPKLTASLAKATVGTAYTGSKISATGTLPINFSYEISASDKTKLGITSLSDLGLNFETNSDDGTAEITGTPTTSVKSLAVTVTATNIAGSATKKLNFSAKGTKPTFTTVPEKPVEAAVDSSVVIKVAVTGTPKITFSMNKVNGFAITQDDDYNATITGMAPSKVGKTSLKVTATNADGKTTKTIVVQAKKAEDIPTPDPDPNPDPDPDPDAGDAPVVYDDVEGEASDEIKQELVTEQGVVNFGAQRSIKSLGSKELDVLEGYTVAAVLPELNVTESGIYDLEVEIEPEIEEGKELFYFAFAKNREKNSDDEFAEFSDLDGQEIKVTTAERKIIVSVWLNAGDTYAPVIAVKDSEQENSEGDSQQ